MQRLRRFAAVALLCVLGAAIGTAIAPLRSDATVNVTAGLGINALKANTQSSHSNGLAANSGFAAFWASNTSFTPTNTSGVIVNELNLSPASGNEVCAILTPASAVITSCSCVAPTACLLDAANSGSVTLPAPVLVPPNWGLQIFNSGAGTTSGYSVLFTVL